MTGGEGASFNFVDYGQAGGSSGTPPPDSEEPVRRSSGGSRWQRDAADGGGRCAAQPEPPAPAGRAGPALGHAAAGGSGDRAARPPDNPLIGSARTRTRSASSAYGLRNPFRFTIKPGTNEVYIGDVGWNTWEEINSVPEPARPERAQLRLALLRGQRPASGLPGGEPRALHVAVHGRARRLLPLYTYNHTGLGRRRETAAPIGSSSVGGMAFYNGGDYPSNYQNALFFSDYSRKCIWVMFPDADGNPDPEQPHGVEVRRRGSRRHPGRTERRHLLRRLRRRHRAPLHVPRSDGARDGKPGLGLAAADGPVRRHGLAARPARRHDHLRVGSRRRRPVRRLDGSRAAVRLLEQGQLHGAAEGHRQPRDLDAQRPARHQRRHAARRPRSSRRPTPT